MKKSIPTALSALFLASTLPAAVDVSFGYTSDYYFRGWQLADEIIEASVEYADDSGFYIGAWTAQPLDSGPDWEIDYYAGYGFGLSETVSLDLGVATYTYETADSTWEPFIGVAVDTTLAPSLYAYYDLDLEILTFEGGISHSIEIDEASGVELAANLGFVTPDEGDEYTYFKLSAGYSYAFSESGSFGLSASYTDASEELTWDDGFYYGASLAFSF
jgi:uncharacterized protein (TIGR02001 family)